MEEKNLQRYLQTFLEISEVQIKIKEKEIKRKQSFKRMMDSNKNTIINAEIMDILEVKHKLEGHLDCIRLEILNMILEDPSLISERVLKKNDCNSVLEFVKQEKEKIELRGLYDKYPFSIDDVLNLSLDDKRNAYSKEEIKLSVDRKIVKTMIKSL